MAIVLFWLVIVFGTCWLFLKLFGARRTRERELDDQQSHRLFRK